MSWLLALWLGSPAGAATVQVLNTLDDGGGSLRKRIESASPGDIIEFALPGIGPHYIDLETELPPLDEVQLVSTQVVILRPDPVLGVPAGTRGLVLDGYGASVRGLRLQGFPGSCIVVRGTSATVGGPVEGDGNRVKDCGESGIEIAATGDLVTVQGNAVGLNIDGTGAGTCANPGTGACAGIWSRGDHVDILDNEIGGTLGAALYAQGSGIFVSSGSDVWVDGNELGLTAGNATYGVLAAAQAGVAVTDISVSNNTVGNSGRAGLYIGTRVTGAELSGSLVGFQTDGLTAAPNGAAGVHVFAADGVMVLKSQIGNSATAGVLLNGQLGGNWHSGGDVSANTIGIDAAGGAASNGGYGIYSEGQEGGYLISSNVIGYNTLGGMSLNDPGHQVRGNKVGTDGAGSDLGNSQVGLRLAASDLVVEENVIADNEGSGIWLFASDGTAVSGVQLVNKRIGQGALYGAQGNAGVGIHLRQYGTGTLTDVLVRDNIVENNQDQGIWVEQGDEVRIIENHVTGNGLCGILVEPAANGGITPPAISHLNDRSVGFTVGDPSPHTVRAVHVYWDPDDEARDYLGQASLEPSGIWEFPSPRRGARGRVSAIVEWSNGATSGLAAHCADGCSVNTNDTCNDGDPCTDDVCDPIIGCSHPAVSNAAAVPCSDGDACTTGTVCVDGACDPTSGTDTPGCALDRCAEDVPGVGRVYRECDGFPNQFCKATECDSAIGCTAKEVARSCSDGSDGSDCTSDSCDETADVCEHEARSSDFICEDGNACTGWGTCDGGGLCINGSGSPVPRRRRWLLHAGLRRVPRVPVRERLRGRDLRSGRPLRLSVGLRGCR